MCPEESSTRLNTASAQLRNRTRRFAAAPGSAAPSSSVMVVSVPLRSAARALRFSQSIKPRARSSPARRRPTIAATALGPSTPASAAAISFLNGELRPASSRTIFANLSAPSAIRFSLVSAARRFMPASPFHLGIRIGAYGSITKRRVQQGHEARLPCCGLISDHGISCVRQSPCNSGSHDGFHRP